MSKKIVITSMALFAVMAFSGCGNDAEQKAKEDQMQADLDAQQQEIDQMKGSLEQEKENMENVAGELAIQTCMQELQLAKTQLELLNNYTAALEDLNKKVEKSPDFAIDICRNLNPGLSKPECDTKVEDYMGGKSVEYDETQEKIAETEKKIAELETVCAAGSEDVLIDANGNVVQEGCQSWFDGCNTCTVGEPGMPMACTMKACDETMMEEARCMD